MSVAPRDTASPLATLRPTATPAAALVARDMSANVDARDGASGAETFARQLRRVEGVAVSANVAATRGEAAVGSPIDPAREGGVGGARGPADRRLPGGVPHDFSPSEMRTGNEGTVLADIAANRSLDVEGGIGTGWRERSVAPATLFEGESRVDDTTTRAVRGSAAKGGDVMDETREVTGGADPLPTRADLAEDEEAQARDRVDEAPAGTAVTSDTAESLPTADTPTATSAPTVDVAKARDVSAASTDSTPRPVARGRGEAVHGTRADEVDAAKPSSGRVAGAVAVESPARRTTDAASPRAPLAARVHADVVSDESPTRLTRPTRQPSEGASVDAPWVVASGGIPANDPGSTDEWRTAPAAAPRTGVGSGASNDVPIVESAAGAPPDRAVPAGRAGPVNAFADAVFEAGDAHAMFDDGSRSSPTTSPLQSLASVASAPFATRAETLPPAMPIAPQSVPLDAARGASEELAASVRWTAGEGRGQAWINVTPAGLGPVAIRVSMEGEQVSVSIAASQVGAREALEPLIPRLREQLAADGHQSVQVDLSGGREDPRSQAEHRGERSEADADGRSGTGRAGEAVERNAERERAQGSRPGNGMADVTGDGYALVDSWA